MTAGIVAAGNHYTAQAGAEILAAGGNAVDSVVAATFVSFLAEIALVHSGGSGLALIYDSRQDECTFYDFFSSGPGLGGQPPPTNLDFHRVTVSYGPATQDFHVGRAAVAVPGNFFGLCRLAAERGRLPLERLLRPAIELAEEGVVLDSFQSQTCNILAPILMHTAEMRKIFCPRGTFVGEGDRLRNPDLAKTLQDLAREGEAYLRNGRLAQLLLDDQRERNGLLTPEDLLNYRVESRPALCCEYHDARVWLPSLPSSGGPLIGLALSVIARLEPPDCEQLALLAEVMAAVNRTRNQWDQWAETLPWEEAAGRLWDERLVEGLTREVNRALERGRTLGTVSERPSPSATTHLSVIDGEGLAVSLTHTAGESAGYVVPGTGFIPNNMMGEADLHPRGFHQIVPGARILTMMAPSILTSKKLGCVALGSGGSTRIRSAMLQVIHHLVDEEMSLEQAIQEPRVHYESGVLQFEPGVSPEGIDCLRRFGYQLNGWPQRHLFFGGANAVGLDVEGSMHGQGDPRRGGTSRLVAGDPPRLPDR